MKLLTMENAMKCGIGEGANCCAFLVVGPDGFECQQRAELDAAIRRKVKMNQIIAARLPEGRFPDCQQEGRT